MQHKYAPDGLRAKFTPKTKRTEWTRTQKPVDVDCGTDPMTIRPFINQSIHPSSHRYGNIAGPWRRASRVVHTHARTHAHSMPHRPTHTNRYWLSLSPRKLVRKLSVHWFISMKIHPVLVMQSLKKIAYPHTEPALDNNATTPYNHDAVNGRIIN